MSLAVKRNNEADELATASRGFIQESAEFEDNSVFDKIVKVL